MRIWLVSFCTLIVSSLAAQHSKAYLFVEPNVSLQYDSSLLHFSTHIPHPIHGTEGYAFTYDFPGRKSTNVQVNTALPVANADKKYRDSVSNAIIKQINRYAGDSIIVKVFRPVNYKGFEGYSYITFHKRSKESHIAFACNQYYPDGVCKFYYMSAAQNTIAGFDKDSQVVSKLLDGIASYSKAELAEEEKAMHERYTIVVDSIGKPQGFNLDATYYGMVKIKGRLENTVQSVDLGYQQFFPDYKNEILIYITDLNKGRIEKTAELILLTKAGKQVRLPFSFSYYNK
jgi:hypothetical protein